jgi:hypothetical protein
MKKEIAQIKYTYSEKVSILKILERNDYNLLKTERTCGISRPTLRRWKEQLGPMVFTGVSPIEEALQRVEIQMKVNDETIIRKYYMIRNQILDRIQELIPSETKLEPLINALKSISLELVVFDEEAKKEQASTSVDIFQTILKNIEKGDFSSDNSMVD